MKSPRTCIWRARLGKILGHQWRIGCAASERIHRFLSLDFAQWRHIHRSIPCHTATITLTDHPNYRLRITGLPADLNTFRSLLGWWIGELFDWWIGRHTRVYLSAAQLCDWICSVSAVNSE
jgi:hypothetical protein